MFTLASCTTTTAPQIVSFSAASNAIVSGESTTLTWNVTGSTPVTLTIDQGVGDVSGTNSTSVAPTATTTYTLTATDNDGTAEAKVTVTVRGVVINEVTSVQYTNQVAWLELYNPTNV